MRFIFCLLLLTAQLSFAQPNNYSKDLEAWYNILSKTYSFKEQITGQKKEAFEKKLQSLRSDSSHSTNSYNYFYNIAQLAFPVRDNHLGFYQLPKIELYKDQSSYLQYFQSADFIRHSKFEGDLDSLYYALTKKSIDSVEGIYHLDTFISIGVYRHTINEYRGVVLASGVTLFGQPVWEKGETLIHLYEYMPACFHAIAANPYNKYLAYFANEKFRNNALVNSRFYGVFYKYNYTKLPKAVDYINLPDNQPDFIFREINNKFHYLGIKNFNSSTVGLQKSSAFYDSIKHIPIVPNLIVDLRNNSGGGYKASKKYFRFIKRYSSKGKVYVLVNNRTYSHGEIFTLKLKTLPNLTVLGETTNGTLTYGSNYGRTITLPSGVIQVYPTDMKGSKKLLPYESFGVKPDIELKNDGDWVEKVLTYQ